jgi:hypothetical protein
MDTAKTRSKLKDLEIGNVLAGLHWVLGAVLAYYSLGKKNLRRHEAAEICPVINCVFQIASWAA